MGKQRRPGTRVDDLERIGKKKREINNKKKDGKNQKISTSAVKNQKERNGTRVIWKSKENPQQCVVVVASCWKEKKRWE